MRTLQSRWNRANAPAAKRLRQTKREAASIAGPAPEYPPTAPLHGDWIGGRINGRTVIIRLCREPWHRCDQRAAEHDGEVIADAIGLTDLHDRLRAMWPRAQSRRAMAVLQQGYTERDEADAMGVA